MKTRIYRFMIVTEGKSVPDTAEREGLLGHTDVFVGELMI